jgi:hypothetical protein
MWWYQAVAVNVGMNVIAGRWLAAGGQQTHTIMKVTSYLGQLISMSVVFALNHPEQNHLS